MPLLAALAVTLISSPAYACGMGDLGFFFIRTGLGVVIPVILVLVVLWCSRPGER